MTTKLDKKSLIQIVLLLLLLLVGGGLYLWQNDQLGFVTELFGDKPAPPFAAPAPTQVARPAPVKPVPPKESGPVIPPGPAKGQLHNRPFTVERAEIENGVLTLRQGQEPLDTDLTVFLNTRPWEVPAGRTFKILNQAAAPDAPHLRMRWREDGQSAPRQREFTEKYTLLLELGEEKDKKLPGKIYVALPDDEKSQVAGTFEAEIRGFRLVDGKPDLSIDSVDTLQFLALREILKDDPDRPVAGLAFRHARFDARSVSGAPATGYLELEYRLGEAQPVAQKFQFVKESDTWRLYGTLGADQLDEAHPYKAPGAKDVPARVFPYLAAKRVEAEVRKKNAGRLVNAAEFSPRYNEKHKLGVCDVSYKLDNGQPVQTTFVYRLGATGWGLVRELGKNERVNLTAGKIERSR